LRRYGRELEPSFECKTANKDHICLFCNRVIKKGTKYFSKTEHSQLVAERLEKETGFTLREIKKRTRFWFLDMLNLKFCSLVCLQNYNQYPEQAYQRKTEIEEGIINRVKDVIELMTKLEGKKKDE